MSRADNSFGTIATTNRIPILRPKLYRGPDFSTTDPSSSKFYSKFIVSKIAFVSPSLSSFFISILFTSNACICRKVHGELRGEIESVEPYLFLGYLLACARLVNRGYKELREILLERYGLRLILCNEGLHHFHSSRLSLFSGKSEGETRICQLLSIVIFSMM